MIVAPPMRIGGTLMLREIHTHYTGGWLTQQQMAEHLGLTLPQLKSIIARNPHLKKRL
jgi:hypothetical protein